MADKKTSGGDSKGQLDEQNPRKNTSRSTSKSFKALLAAVALSITTLYCTSGSQFFIETRQGDSFPFNVSKQLPSDTYAICSPESDGDIRNAIYTVDENNAQVECILVDGERVVEGGSLGA